MTIAIRFAPSDDIALQGSGGFLGVGYANPDSPIIMGTAIAEITEVRLNVYRPLLAVRELQSFYLNVIHVRWNHE